MGETIMGYLGAVGFKLKMRPMERATFFSAWATKKLRGVCVCASALYGNAATRMSEIVPSDGAYAYGGYPDIDALYKQQARETDRKKREALLNQIQQTLHDRVRFGPISVELNALDCFARGHKNQRGEQRGPSSESHHRAGPPPGASMTRRARLSTGKRADTKLD